MDKAIENLNGAKIEICDNSWVLNCQKLSSALLRQEDVSQTSIGSNKSASKHALPPMPISTLLAPNDDLIEVLMRTKF